MSDDLSLSSVDPSKAGRPPFQIGTLLSETFRVLVANFVPFLVLVALILSPVIVITVASARNALAEGQEPFTVWEIVAVFLALVLTQVATAALIYGVFQFLRGTPATLVDCITRGLRKTPVAIVTGIVYSVLVALGSLLCIVPGIYLGVIYCVAVPAAVLEEKGVFDAMRRSKELTVGHAWTLLASYLLLIIGLALVNVTGMLALMSFPLASGIWTSALQILQAMVQATLIAVAYYQLRSTEEDLDLVAIAKVFE